MADEKITELDPKATIANTDLFVIMDEEAGPDQTKYITGAHLKAAILAYLSGTIKATDVEVAELGTATYDDVQDAINAFANRTLLSGGGITAHGDADGSVVIAACTAWSKVTDSDTAVGKFFDYAGKAKQTLTDLSVNLIYLDYNEGGAGVPGIVVATNPVTYGFQQDHILVGVVFRQGNVPHIFQSSNIGIQGINRAFMHSVEHHGAHRSSGLVTSDGGALALSITAGIIYAGLNRQATTVDGSTWSYWYTTDSGATWAEDTGIAALVQSYNNITAGKVALTANRYGVHWVYVDYEGTHVHIVYGQGDYTAGQAEQATPPSVLPPIVSTYSCIIAKIINQEGETDMTITYPWTQVFTSSLATDHNSLVNLLVGDPHTQYILKSILTTRGDIFFRNATVPARLAKGTEGQFLTMGVSDPAWGDAADVTTATVTLYVDAGSGSDSNAGTSGSPKATIQGALDALPVVIAHACTICVRGQQNYTESNATINFDRFATLATITIKVVNSSDEDMYDYGLATSGGADDLDDSGASWSTNQFLGAYIWIYEGTGAGQIREILANTSTRIIISILGGSDWTTNPDNTSRYVVGGGATMTGTSAYHFYIAGKKVSVTGFKHTGATSYDIRWDNWASGSAFYNYCSAGVRVGYFSTGSCYRNYFITSANGHLLSYFAFGFTRGNVFYSLATAGLSLSVNSLASCSGTAGSKNWFYDMTYGVRIQSGSGVVSAGDQVFDGCTTDIDPDPSENLPKWWTT